MLESLGVCIETVLGGQCGRFQSGFRGLNVEVLEGDPGWFGGCFREGSRMFSAWVEGCFGAAG